MGICVVFCALSLLVLPVSDHQGIFLFRPCLISDSMGGDRCEWLTNTLKDPGSQLLFEASVNHSRLSPIQKLIFSIFKFQGMVLSVLISMNVQRAMVVVQWMQSVIIKLAPSHVHVRWDTRVMEHTVLTSMNVEPIFMGATEMQIVQIQWDLSYVHAIPDL